MPFNAVPSVVPSFHNASIDFKRSFQAAIVEPINSDKPNFKVTDKIFRIGMEVKSATI